MITATKKIVKTYKMKDKYIVYTDGSCHNKVDSVGGWAYLIIHNGQTTVASDGEYPSTSNRMELTAALEALLSTPRDSVVEIYSDSKYTVNTINDWLYSWEKKGWKNSYGDEVKNMDIMLNLKEQIDYRKVKAIWVKGHNGNEYNEYVDKLARDARADFIDKTLDLQIQMK